MSYRILLICFVLVLNFTTKAGDSFKTVDGKTLEEISRDLESIKKQTSSLREQSLEAFKRGDLVETQRLVQEEIVQYPIVKWQSGDISISHRIYWTGAYNGVQNIWDRFEIDYKYKMIAFFKGVKCSQLGSIFKEGLNSKYGGKNGASEDAKINLNEFDRGKMFFTDTYENARSYVFSPESDGSVCVLKIKIPLQDTIKYNFVYQVDWFFVGVIPAQYISVVQTKTKNEIPNFIPLANFLLANQLDRKISNPEIGSICQ